MENISQEGMLILVKRLIIFIFIVAALKPNLFAQTGKSKVDSLILLSKSNVDTVRLEALKALTWECRLTNQIKGFEYGYDGLALAEKLDRKNDVATLHNYIGVLAIKIKSFEIAKVQINKAFKLADSLGFTIEKAYALNNLGEIYNLTGKPDSAVILLNEAIRLFKFVNNKNGLAYTYNQMGSAMLLQKKYTEAITYHLAMLEIRKNLGNKAYITQSILNLGLDYLEMGNPDEAIKYINQVDTSILENRFQFSLAYIYVLRGRAMKAQKNLNAARGILIKALNLADSLKLFYEMAEASKTLGEIASEMKDYKTSLHYFNIYRITSDSIKNTNLILEVRQIEMKREFEEQYKFLEFKMQQDIDTQKIKLYWSKILIYSFIVFLSVLVFLILILIRNSKKIERQNKLLINQQKEIEEKNLSIVQQWEDLKKLNATKDKFFSILAHDLRGPIGNFHNFTKMLIDNHKTELSESLMNLIIVVNDSTEHTVILLEDVLTWAKSQQGTISFNPQIGNLSYIVKNNLNLFNSKAEEKKIQIVNNLPAEIVVKMDYYMIDTVFRNLLSNALKFTDFEGKIELSAIIEKNCVKLKVSDTGIGIPTEEIENLFKIDIKHKSKPGTSGEKGTGLGLVLCREFIEKHGGEINVESEVGKGSTFCFSLPLL
ncbi:MAG: tetratricopeptide repeat-containing sensor histidine kinase [Bacteroidales bacterium]